MSRAHSKAGGADDSFDDEVREFSNSTNLDIKDTQLKEQLAQNLSQFKVLRSPTAGTLSREESRDNSVIGSIIDDDLETDETLSDTVNGTRIYNVSDIIDALNKPRNRINTDARNYLLQQAQKIVTHRPHAIEVSEEDMEQLIEFIKSSRSEIETILAIQLATSYAGTDSDEVGVQVMDELIPLLFGKIFNDNESTSVRCNAMRAYFALLLFMFDGSDCYSLADTINDFLELIEGYQTTSTDADSDIVADTINGLGVVFSLLYKSGHDLDETIEDTIPRLLPFLGSDYSQKVHKSTAILLGLLYEIYDYSDGQEPYYDEDEVKGLLKGLSRESAKKTGKSNRKETQSVYRSVLKTIEQHEDTDDEESQSAISKLPLSKSKQLPIYTWFEYARLIALKYAFGTELSSHYLDSSETRSLLAGPGKEFQDNDDDEVAATGKHWKTREEKISGKKMTVKRHADRDEKLKEEMDNLNI